MGAFTSTSRKSSKIQSNFAFYLIIHHLRTANKGKIYKQSLTYLFQPYVRLWTSFVIFLPSTFFQFNIAVLWKRPTLAFWGMIIMLIATLKFANVWVHPLGFFDSSNTGRTSVFYCVAFIAKVRKPSCPSEKYPAWCNHSFCNGSTNYYLVRMVGNASRHSSSLNLTESAYNNVYG